MHERLLKVINDYFGTDYNLENKGDINPQAFEKWDSIAHLNLVICIEDEFGVMFEPGEITEMLGGFEGIAAVLDKKGVK